LTQLAIGLGLALFPKQIRQLGDARRDPSRLILRQQLRRLIADRLLRMALLGAVLIKL
jgi:hypothetical protein